MNADRSVSNRGQATMGTKLFFELFYRRSSAFIGGHKLFRFSTCVHPSSAIGRARLPVSTANALAAFPATARAITPWKIAAARNMLYAMQKLQSFALQAVMPVRSR